MNFISYLKHFYGKLLKNILIFRNKNLDMLAALRIRLSQLETSDDLLDDCCMKLVQFYLAFTCKNINFKDSFKGEEVVSKLRKSEKQKILKILGK